MNYHWKTDCRSFLGTYPCNLLKSEELKSCEDCLFYEPTTKKILIIKLGASGDVIRTTPILEAIKSKYGEDTTIAWVVNKESEEILKNTPHIDKVLVYNLDNVLRLKCQEFDVLFSLEIDAPGSAISSLVNAKEKYGYFLNKNGLPQSFNKTGEYYLERAFSDHFNKKNTKTYPEMIFEICELSYHKERYALFPTSRAEEYSMNFLNSLNLDKSKKIIGINLGSGGRFPSRMISKEKIILLAEELSKDYNIFLLGGMEEVRYQKELIEELMKKNVRIYSNNPENSKEEFIGVLNSCEVLITGDSFAMHAAIGLGKKVIALFFSTPPSEIEDYEVVKKLISPLCTKYLYSEDYIPELVNSISVEEIVRAVKTF